MQYFKTIVIILTLLILESCYTYQLALPLSTSTGRVIIAGREKYSIETGFSLNANVPVLVDKSIAFSFIDTFQQMGYRTHSPAINTNFQLTKSVNIGVSYSDYFQNFKVFQKDGIDEKLSRDEDCGYLDISALLLTPSRNKHIPLLGVLVKQSYSYSTIFQKYGGQNYYGYARGRSLTVFPFLSSEVTTFLWSIVVQSQIGYYLSRTVADVEIDESNITMNTSEYYHGLKLKGAVSFENTAALGFDYLILNNGLHYIGISTSIVFGP